MLCVCLSSFYIRLTQLAPGWVDHFFMIGRPTASLRWEPKTPGLGALQVLRVLRVDHRKPDERSRRNFQVLLLLISSSVASETTRRPRLSGSRRTLSSKEHFQSNYMEHSNTLTLLGMPKRRSNQTSQWKILY